MAINAWQLTSVIAILTVITLSVGCNSVGPGKPAPPEALQPVSGLVNVDGKPTEGVRVRFVRTGGDEALQVTCTTITDADGKFTCPTYMNLNGLPAGKYAVFFEWPVPTCIDPTDGETDKFKGKYGPQSRQKQTVEIKAGDNQLPVFNLK